MNSSHILSTGLSRCYNEEGDVIECRGSGQDAEFQLGVDWPAERFETTSDHLVTGQSNRSYLDKKQLSVRVSIELAGRTGIC